MSETWTHTGFETIARLIAARTGIGFETRGPGDMERATRHAMTKTGVNEPDEFARRLQSDDGVWDELIEEITVRETYFFRNPEHFELVRQRILPALAELRPEGHGLRVWSAGCASGEEAYSLAMFLHQQGLLDKATVCGSDLCERALVKARAGRYRDWSLRGVDRTGLGRYLRTRGDETTVCDELRQKVRFGRLNLADDTYPSVVSGIWEMDLIFCRNVLIYLSPQVIARVERGFFDALAPGGWLVAGPSDPLLGKHAPFETITTEHGLLYHKPGPSVVEAPRKSIRVSYEQPLPSAERSDSAHRTLAAPKTSKTSRVTSSKAARVPRSSVPARTAAPDVGASAAAQVRSIWRASGAAAARAACEKAIARHALAAELHYLHALTLMDLGADPEAIRAARQCLYLDRSLVMAHFTLAALLRRSLDHKGARRAYRSVLEASSSLPPEQPIAMGDGVTANHLALAAQRALGELETD
jgi:chemotaxis protein methyltransferase CheR